MKYLADFRRGILPAASLATLVSFAGLASAGTVTVTTQDMSVGSGNGCSLPEAISAVNNGSNFSGCDFQWDGSSELSIVVPDGDYYPSSELIFTADAEVFASPAVVLHASGDYGFWINGGAGTPRVVLNGLTIQSADVQPAALGVYASGGATLVARNITVSDCSSAGILIDGAALEMDNTELSNNGAGLEVLGGEAFLLNNFIANNSSDGMFVDAAQVEVFSTTFNANGGHGATVSGTGILTLTNSTASGNGGNGAALLVDLGDENNLIEPQLLVEGCLFQGNAESGVLNSNGTALINNSQLSGNSNSGLRNARPEPEQNGASTTTCQGCLIRDNFAQNGGGIWNGADSDSKIYIYGSAIIDNVAFVDGGGVLSLGQPAFYSTTFSGNFAFRDAGGLHITGNELNLWHVTITDNQALGKAGGLYAHASQPRVRFSIIAGNLAPLDPDLNGSHLQGHYSLVGGPEDETDWSPFGEHEGMIFDIDPELDDLQNVDGVTWAHPPLPGSPVVDAIPLANCNLDAGDPPTPDQRGVVRPLGSGCDIGAVEVGEPGALPNIEALSWTSSNATLALNSQLHTEGAYGLSVGGNGYRVVNSAVFSTVPFAGSQLLLDFYSPVGAPNPYWLGAVQMFGTCAGANLYNVYLGQRELTGLPTGQFSVLSFSVPSSLQTAFGQDHDCFLSVAVNANATPLPPVLDNLRFAD